MKIIKEMIVFLLPILITLIIVISIRMFLLTPVIVDGISMESSLYDGDILLLNKYHYWFNDVLRYDIVAIEYEDSHIIKRVIGKPGDTISYADNKLYVNGFEAIDLYNSNVTSNFNSVTIPDDYYFVMGDNRQHSLDSRSFGLVSLEDIIGVVRYRVFPFESFGRLD